MVAAHYRRKVRAKPGQKCHPKVGPKQHWTRIPPNQIFANSNGMGPTLNGKNLLELFFGKHLDFVTEKMALGWGTFPLVIDVKWSMNGGQRGRGTKINTKN
jgi:hypothetical protein